MMAFNEMEFEDFEKVYYSPEGGKDFGKTAKILKKKKEELELYYIMIEYEERITELEAKLANAQPKPKAGKGIVLPKVYPKILSLARRRKNILLVGPAGCGKTTIAHQVALDLKLPFYSVSMSEGMTETQLLGRREPSQKGGFKYVPSPLTIAAENGGVILIDEMDAGNSNTQLCLNNILSGKEFSVPNKCDNTNIVKHSDFVAIASANTFGHGADRVYVGRNQLDGATLDRFKVGTVYMDYDPIVEKAVVRDDILTWGLEIRQFIRELSMRQILSTRFLRDLSDMADDDGFKDTSDWWEVLVASWSNDDKMRVQNKLVSRKLNVSVENGHVTFGRAY